MKSRIDPNENPVAQPDPEQLLAAAKSAWNERRGGQMITNINRPASSRQKIHEVKAASAGDRSDIEPPVNPKILKRLMALLKAEEELVNLEAARVNLEAARVRLEAAVRAEKSALVRMARRQK